MLDIDRATLPALDLRQVMAKLMHPKVGEGWDWQRAEAAERDYRRFLFLVQCYPGQMIAPRPDADVVWHYHISDTRKYAADCAALFGYFLHHVPELETDRPGIDLRGQTAALTEALYRQVFTVAADGREADSAQDAVPGAAFNAKTSCASSTQDIDDMDSFVVTTAERAC